MYVYIYICTYGVEKSLDSTLPHSQMIAYRIIQTPMPCHAISYKPFASVSHESHGAP